MDRGVKHILFLKRQRWPTDIWKDVEHHWSSGNCKSNHSEISPHVCQMSIINKTKNNKGWWGGGRAKGTVMYCWRECKLEQPLWKKLWRFFKKLKMELLYDPAIPFLGVYREKIKTLLWKDICSSMFSAALFTIAKMWKQPKCPSIDKWIK